MLQFWADKLIQNHSQDTDGKPAHMGSQNHIHPKSSSGGAPLIDNITKVLKWEQVSQCTIEI